MQIRSTGAPDRSHVTGSVQRLTESAPRSPRAAAEDGQRLLSRQGRGAGSGPAPYGNQPKAFPPFIPSHPVTILNATVGADRLWAIVIAVIMLGVFTVFFRRSKEGIAMRAVADDQQASLSMGISVKKIFAWAWSIAAISAAIGGALVANIVGVSQELSYFGLRVFPVVILGGLDSIPGAIIGGVVIGLLEAYTGGYIGQGLNQVIPFIVLIIILMVRPYGLFGQEIIERV